MTQIALIKHRTRPGKRDGVHRIWERHMAPAIAANPGHAAYVAEVEPLLTGQPEVTPLTPVWQKASR